MVKATFAALDSLRTRERIEQLRGVTLGTTTVEDAIARGVAAMPSQKSGERAAAPVNTVGDERRRGGGGGGGGGGGRFGGGGGGGRSSGGRPRSDGGDRGPAPTSVDAPAAPASALAPALAPESPTPPVQS